MEDEVFWCWRTRTYAASEVRHEWFCRTIHLTPSVFEHCGIATCIYESESPCPHRGHFRDGDAFRADTHRGALSPPRRPPLQSGSGGLGHPLYVYRLSCLRIEGSFVDEGREERIRPPAHRAAASGDGEERFLNMSTCASPFAMP